MTTLRERLFDLSSLVYKPQVEQRPVNTVRVCAISDLHLKFKQLSIPKCDVLVIAGDITNVGDYKDVSDFNIWAHMLQERGFVGQVVCIAGNHDITAQTDPETFKYLLPDVTYLNEESVRAKGLLIYGTPWSPQFGRGWAFNAERGADIQKHWDKIPYNLDVLIVHGPPYGHNDMVEDHKGVMNEHVGCWNLRETILEKKPRVVVCGHIHEGYGMSLLGSSLILNAAVCNYRHQPVNPPLVIDL